MPIASRVYVDGFLWDWGRFVIRSPRVSATRAAAGARQTIDTRPPPRRQCASRRDCGTTCPRHLCFAVATSSSLQQSSDTMTQRDEGTLDNNLSLIVEIQKYEYLYNFNMPEYSKKDMTEKAWGEISKKIGVSINDCKEKWRNIRSAFLRSLKTTGGKSKRPYYLTEELKFVMPYIKPHHQSVVGTLYSSSADSAESRLAE